MGLRDSIGPGNFSEFDDDGVSQSREVNQANEITDITGGWITPSYDRAGNMISGPKPGSETNRIHMIYDAWNRLVKVQADDSGDPGEVISQYEYNGTNRRIEKVVTEEGGGPTHVHYYYNHEWQMLEEQFVDNEGALLADNQYVWSLRYIDAPIVRFHDGNGDGDYEDAGDNVLYYTTDANHNVTGLVGLVETSPEVYEWQVVERYVYDPYGKATVYDEDWSNTTSPTTDGPLYCGYWFDAETGLYQVRNRYYNSSLATFISRDPIQADINPYRYCGNDPTNKTDPSGEKWWSPSDWWEWAKSWFTSCDPSSGSGGLDCAAEICKTENMINYPLWRRNHEEEGSAEWKYWNGVYQNALKQSQKPTCPSPPNKCKK